MADQTTDVVTRLRDPSSRIRGDVATMAEAAAVIESLRAALHDIATERGCCRECGRAADMPENFTPRDCDRRDCAWQPMNPAAVAKKALSNVG